MLVVKCITSIKSLICKKELLLEIASQECPAINVLLHPVRAVGGNVKADLCWLAFSQPPAPVLISSWETGTAGAVGKPELHQVRMCLGLLHHTVRVCSYMAFWIKFKYTSKEMVKLLSGFLHLLSFCFSSCLCTLGNTISQGDISCVVIALNLSVRHNWVKCAKLNRYFYCEKQLLLNNYLTRKM